MQVSELSEQLKNAAIEAEYINGQEKMFGWAMTKYGNVTKVRGPGCCDARCPVLCSSPTQHACAGIVGAAPCPWLCTELSRLRALVCWCVAVLRCQPVLL